MTGYSTPSSSTVLSLVTVERVRNVSPEPRSRKTTAWYSGWMSVFMGGPLRCDALDFARADEVCGANAPKSDLTSPHREPWNRPPRGARRGSGCRAGCVPAILRGQRDRESESLRQILGGEGLVDGPRRHDLA